VREEINCSRCTTEVLVVDVPDKAQGDEIIAQHGWIASPTGPLCPTCQHQRRPAGGGGVGAILGKPRGKAATAKTARKVAGGSKKR
jgi:hypothetical protein